MRWGILGAANFALEHMGPAIHAARGNTLAALATSSPEKAIAFQAFAPDLDVIGDYDALLASDSIDAVYIPLPNHLHVEWSKKALAAGKHVLCEKPIALKADEIDGLIAARDASGCFLAEAFMITHHPQWHKVRDLLAARVIGELRHVDVTFSFNNPDANNIRNKPETGGGSIYDIGVYTYGAARYVTGAEPVNLASRIRYENGVDVFAHAVGEMEGPLGRFTYSGITSTRLANRQDMVFQGDQGTISLHAPFNAGVIAEAQVIVRTADGTKTVHAYPRVNQYVLQVENFARHVEQGGEYPCPLEFTRGTQAMIDLVFAQSTDIS